MVPILYEKDETSFTSNGLGRLRDCISCVVTEERNGIYECDFEYPVDGRNFEQLQCGRIIGVTHDNTGDVQPFDIVSYSKPINGVVSFHAVHLSYRQKYITVYGSKAITSLADAFDYLLVNGTVPANPFSYEAYFAATGLLPVADKTPRSVRQILGGVEGSILDTYGGEYEWDKWKVILHQARGRLRDFTIRYGINMTDFTDELNSEGTYNSCIPYWTDGTNLVYGNKVSSGQQTIAGREQCVPLDLSTYYETQPSRSQLESKALTYMRSNNSYSPGQSIHVEFVRLDDMAENIGYKSLMTCNLCDQIKVVYPDYSMSGYFKIVKTVWNVLKNRFDSMELGDLTTTLSEALGISSTTQIVTQSTSTSISALSVPCFGFITTGGNDMDIYFMFEKNPSAISITGALSQIRHVGGGYVGGAINTNISSYYVASATTKLTTTGWFRIRFTKSNGWGVTNNTPVIGNIVLDGTITN